jgi:hypothetical protein
MSRSPAPLATSLCNIQPHSIPQLRYLSAPDDLLRKASKQGTGEDVHTSTQVPLLTRYLHSFFLNV